MRIIPLTIAGGIALALTGGVASAQQQFNGDWSIEVITESGSCDRAYRFPVMIQNGQVRYGGPQRVSVSGAVTPTGDIRGSVGRGSAQANVMGRLSGRSGSGTWEGSGRLRCAGHWRAEKQA